MKDPKTIVITGVGRGLGRAMTREFIQGGHRVAGCSRTPQLVADLRQQFASPHRFETVDVTNCFSSTWGRTTSPEVAPYCASKWAIEGLTKALADELPRGMAAVAFNPGVIHTEMLESCFGRGAAAYPDPTQWVKKAGPILLELGRSDNGRSVSVS